MPRSDMRPRKSNRELPACVYLRHSAYWYVKKGKWTRLGADLKTALAEYSRIQSNPTEGMPGLLTRWIDGSDHLAEKTKKSYGVAVRKLCLIMAEFSPEQVTARDIRAILHHHRDKPATGNLLRNVLIGALELACIEGLVDRNVARDTQPAKMRTRTRYITNEEFQAIREKATPTLRTIMDLCYLTGQRIGDVLAIRHADITEAGIAFSQQKTKHRMIVGWTDELRYVIAEAKAMHTSLRGLTLLHTRHGKPFSYSTIRTLWDRAIASAGVEDAHLHDLRAKSGTDAKAQGIDAMKLLGHTTESSHNRYQRSREIPVATPPSIGLSNRKPSKA